MSLKKTTFDVAMLDGSEQQVDIILGDQLRGELEGKKRGLGHDYAMHTSALWAWAAMVRCGHFEGSFDEFTAACRDYSKADPIGESDEVPPTPLAASPDSA